MAASKALRDLLLSGKFCWYNGELVAEEFWGIDGMMGFYDHVQDYVDTAEKNAYIAGYMAASPKEPEEARLTALHYAEKEYQKAGSIGVASSGNIPVDEPLDDIEKNT